MSRRESTARYSISCEWDGTPCSDLSLEPYRLSARLEAPWLEIELDAPLHGDPAPDCPPGRCDGLWNFEVVELFAATADGRYIEIEIGPHGHYLVLLFAGYRRQSEVVDECTLDVRAVGSRWSATFALANDRIPAPLERANAFAIHGVGDARRYLAAQPLPTERPDFHRVDLFAPLRGRLR
ncbi:MAG: hypothetical protein KC609_04365 [Myxococcales bacterium]|nr:hypothetical protein [Myxococcales bacterium]